MKKIALLLITCTCLTTFSQSGNVSLIAKNEESNASHSLKYIPNEQTSEELVADYIYVGSSKQTSVLTKKENYYEFNISVPDSIQGVIISVLTKSDKKTFDNNDDQGFKIALGKNSAISFLKLQGPSNYYLKTNIASVETILKYEELFEQKPELKTDENYLNYLSLRYRANPKTTKDEFVQFTENLTQNADESSLTLALTSYSILKMNDQRAEIESLLLANYPLGKFAQRKFISSIYRKKEKTEEFILKSYDEYLLKFNDHSQKTKDTFYFFLISIFLENRDSDNLRKYEKLISNKESIARQYNGVAWRLSGQNITTPGKELEFAEDICENAIKIIDEKMANAADDAARKKLDGIHFMIADTYALVLYKLKKYDLAFELMNSLMNPSIKNNHGERDRLVYFALESKGAAYTKKMIEGEFSTGNGSLVQLQLLEDIYNELKLPKNDFDKLSSSVMNSLAQKRREEIIKLYGSDKEIDFSLTNLEGENVQLSDYKGKVVVLDFWATWCGPCKASFPKMQELVSKYKNEDVAFFFINVWERTKPEEINKKVVEFINENNYSFNVLYDYKGKVVGDYKIKGIPTKIVIDKEGTIINHKTSDENIAALIDAYLQ